MGKSRKSAKGSGMKKSFKQFQLYTLLMFFWIVLNGQIDIKNIIYGTVFSIVIILMTYKVIFELDKDILRLPQTWRFVWFALIVFVEIIKATNKHVIRIIKNEKHFKVFDVNLETNNLVIITLIANAITLTPGTITLDVEDRTLKVLSFVKNDEDIVKIKEEILNFQKPFLYRRK